MSRKFVEGTEGYVYLEEDGNPQVIPEVHEQLEKHKQKRETCVQYVAVASGDGYRAGVYNKLHKALKGRDISRRGQRPRLG